MAPAVIEPKPLSVVAVVLALGLTGFAYLSGLDRAPVYIGGDEAYFAVNGHALATTGRDLTGARLPLLFNLWDPQGDMAVQSRFRAWYQPVLFYLVALTLQVLPFNEVSVRLPMAIVGGVVSPVLMYIVAMRLLKDRRVALLAAMVLALSPSLLLMSRQTLDYVCPVPFVLGWLWCLVSFVESGKPSRAFLGGLVLGAGFYSYVAAWLFTPLCLVLTWVTCFRVRSNPWRASVLATAGFLIPLALLIPWAWMHPETFRETARRYLVGDGVSITLAEGVQRFARLSHLRQIAETYVSYFDPMFLFVRGGARLTTTTGRAGVFVIAAAAFLAAGVYEVLRRRRRDVLAVVLLAGVLLSPVPASLVNERYMIQREIFLLPFAAAIAGYGASRLFADPRRWVRVSSMALFIAMPLQFAYVHRDYSSLYQNRSAFYFDPVVFTTVAETLAAVDAPAIFLSHDVNDGGPRLRFHATKLGRLDLLARARYVDPDGDEIADAQPGSLLVVYHDGATLQRLAAAGQWSVVRLIEDIDRRPASVVLRRN